MDAKTLKQTVKALNKAAKAMEDQSLALSEIANRFVEYQEFLEQELKTLKELDDEQANPSS